MTCANKTPLRTLDNASLVRLGNNAEIQGVDAIVLAGGESRRMGSPKANLPLGGSTLIGAVVDALQPLFNRVIVVSRDERFPELDCDVVVDRYPGRGPLVGLASGLAASSAPCCFAVACDMPFLEPAVIRQMSEYIGAADIVAPVVEGRAQPLHAFYSRSCLPLAECLLGQGLSSMKALFAKCHVRLVAALELTGPVTGSRWCRDLDTPEEYLAALSTSKGEQYSYDHNQNEPDNGARPG